MGFYQGVLVELLARHAVDFTYNKHFRKFEAE